MALPNWTPINGNISLTQVHDYGVGNATLAAIKNLQNINDRAFQSQMKIEELAFQRAQKLGQQGADYNDKLRLEGIQAQRLAEAKALEQERYDAKQERLKNQDANTQAYRMAMLDNKNKTKPSKSTGYKAPIDTYKNNQTPFVLPDVTTKEVEVDDTSKLLAVEPDATKLEKMTAQAIKQYKFEESKYKGKPLVNLDPEVKKAYEHLSTIEKGTEAYRLEASKLADLINTKEHRVEHSWWDKHIGGYKSPYESKKARLEKELGLHTYKFTDFVSPKSFLEFKLNSKNGPTLRKNPKVAEYLSLLDHKPEEKKPYSAEEALKGIENRLKLDSTLSAINKKFDPMTSDAYTKKYAKRTVKVEATPEEQIKALQAEREKVTSTKAGTNDIYSVIAAIESKGDYNAKNPNTSAHGKYQFTNATEKSLAKELGMSITQIRTPEGQEKAMRLLTDKNITVLNNLKVPVTPFNIYGIHQLGSGNFSDLANGRMTPKLKKALRNNLTPSENKAVKDKDLANFWSTKFKTLVESKGATSTSTVNAKAVKQIDTRIQALSKLVAKRNESSAKAKAKKQESSVKKVSEIKKAKLAAAKTQFEADSSVYRQMLKDGKVPKGKTQPLLSDYITAAKTSTPYVYKFK